MNIFSKNTVIAVALVVLTIFGMWWGLPDASSSEPISNQTVSDADSSEVNTLISLRAVTLTGTIFADPAFLSLHDSGVDIVNEDSGRKNPFAPLGAGRAPAPVNATIPAITPVTPAKTPEKAR